MKLLEEYQAIGTMMAPTKKVSFIYTEKGFHLDGCYTVYAPTPEAALREYMKRETKDLLEAIRGQEKITEGLRAQLRALEALLAK